MYVDIRCGNIFNKEKVYDANYKDNGNNNINDYHDYDSNNMTKEQMLHRAIQISLNDA